MSTNGKILGKTLTVLAPLGIAMAVMIYRTENQTYHHDMSRLTASVIALALVVIVAPFAYRYARDSAR